MAIVNRQIILTARPVGFPKVSDFDLVYTPLPSPAAGEVLVRSIYLSLEPSLRELMNEADSGARPVALGDVMAGGGVAFVVRSEDPGFRAGENVLGRLGWQEYAVVPGHELRKLDVRLAPISTALGVLGVPGLTAFFGLLEICDPRPGETVVVSGATGAVGMVVGQIAKIKGCRVVGVGGREAQVAWLQSELGFDGAVRHRQDEDFPRELERLCPDGIDVYFDNVGGELTDAVVSRLNPRARISVCAQTSQDNLAVRGAGPRWLGQLIVKQAKVEGFLVSGYAERFPEALAQLARWFEQGKLKYREDIAQGLEAAPQAFIAMLQGKSQGKQLVQLSE